MEERMQTLGFNGTQISGQMQNLTEASAPTRSSYVRDGFPKALYVAVAVNEDSLFMLQFESIQCI